MTALVGCRAVIVKATFVFIVVILIIIVVTIVTAVAEIEANIDRLIPPRHRPRPTGYASLKMGGHMI